MLSNGDGDDDDDDDSDSDGDTDRGSCKIYCTLGLQQNHFKI